MTRTITLAKSGRRYVFRCTGNVDPELVDKLIQLARTRPDAAKVHRFEERGAVARDLLAAG
jgi:hypothetical protein